MNTFKNKDDGTIIVLVAVFLALFMLSLASVVDIGWILVAENQLQNAADASSLAAVSKIIDEDLMSQNSDQTDDAIEARDSAETYAAYHKAGQVNLQIHRNDDNTPTGDLVLGYIEDPNDLDSPFQTDNVPQFNSVRVVTKLAQDINGPLGLFFGMYTGMDTVEITASSTATVDDRIIGFALADGETLSMLPFTILRDSWIEAFDGENHPANNTCPHEPDEDNYRYADGEVYVGQSDGIPEIRLYPNKEGVCGQTELSGNFGTVDIGYSSNSTSDIAHQILEGISKNELDFVGGIILEDSDGDGIFSKWLNGDTGVSNSFNNELDIIAGESRIVPLFRQAFGTGDGVDYEIVTFAGVRVMDVNMIGALEARHILVQPCQVVSHNAVVDVNAPHSGYVYTMAITR